MLALNDKKAIVADVASHVENAHAGIAADYTGIGVADMTELRVKAREAGVYLRVVRNTLARRALENTEFACMSEGLTGQLVLAFSIEEPSSAARVISDFAKGNKNLEVKVVALRGKLLAPEDVKKLASMPTKDEAISQLMSVMKAPVSKLVQTLAAPGNKLARTLSAVRDQKAA